MLDSVLAAGIDVGGSGAKGALVSISAAGTTYSVAPSVPLDGSESPTRVVEAIATMISSMECGPDVVGVAMTGTIAGGLVLDSEHFGPSWTGYDLRANLEKELQRPIVLSNDADAAAHAEVTLGAGAEEEGEVLVLTFGTGIGSSLFKNGDLVEFLDFGITIKMDGTEAEAVASARAKVKEGLSWSTWVSRVNRFIDAVEEEVEPDLLVLGGAISVEFHAFEAFLRPRGYPVVPARFRGDAGLVGAALLARSNTATLPTERGGGSWWRDPMETFRAVC